MPGGALLQLGEVECGWPEPEWGWGKMEDDAAEGRASPPAQA